MAKMQYPGRELIVLSNFGTFSNTRHFFLKRLSSTGNSLHR